MIASADRTCIHRRAIPNRAHTFDHTFDLWRV